MAGFAKTTNIKIIAEGIEEAAELQVLLELGIDYGQGYYLGMPEGKVQAIDAGISELIKDYHKKQEALRRKNSLNTCIGEIDNQQITFPANTKGGKILEYLKSINERIDIILVNEAKPIGLLSQDVFYSQLTTQYGIALYSNRPIKLLMDDKPLMLDYHTSIEEAAQQAMSRAANKIYDSLIITKDGDYHGTVTIKKLLEVTTKLEMNRAKYANPLTGLPGNIMIDREIKHYISDLIPFTAIYIDLDNFKIYNDVYGFEDGDMVLVETAQILKNLLANISEENFLGHIGGDDYIILLKDTDSKKICQQIIQRFDARVNDFYSLQHQQQQYVMAKNRSGKIEKIPLMSISLAVLQVDSKLALNAKKLAAQAASVKKLCKASCVSNFVIRQCVGE